MTGTPKAFPAKGLSRAVIALLGVFVVAFASMPAGAQKRNGAEPDVLSETYGSWVLRCGKSGKGCHVFQGLVRKKDRARLARATIFAPADKGGQLRLRALVPLGVDLKKGAALSIDKGAPWNIPFLSCWRWGCVAELMLPASMERRLRAGKTLTVTIIGLKGSKPVRFGFSLKGMSRALGRLRSK